jgi:hypothetical protein
MATAQQLDDWFTYHSPLDGQIDRYQQLREAAKQFASLVNELVPQSPEKNAAIASIRSAVMWSNAGIACNEKLPPDAPYASPVRPPHGAAGVQIGDFGTQSSTFR